jgi:hypothetical protein
MKKILSIALLFVCMSMLAQDSTDVGAMAGQTAKLIFQILQAFGIDVKGWQAIIVFLIPFVFRYFGKKRLNNKHASEIKKIVEAYPEVKNIVNTSEPKPGFFKRLFGKK